MRTPVIGLTLPSRKMAPGVDLFVDMAGWSELPLLPLESFPLKRFLKCFIDSLTLAPPIEEMSYARGFVVSLPK
jgi:hypothetical protein